MITVKKYTTFDELKSIKEIAIDSEASMKKHNEFKKIILTINSRKSAKKDNTRPDSSLWKKHY